MKTALSLLMLSLALCGAAADDETSRYAGRDDPVLPLVSPETRVKAIRDLKRCDRRAKNFNISLNRGKMEKLKGDRLFKVLAAYDRFLAILETLPEDFVKACRISTVWFSDEIVDMEGKGIGGVASGEGIELPLSFATGVVYHEMFHKFEGSQISPADKKEWEECNPDGFIYTGSKWAAFTSFMDKKRREKFQKRLAAGKEKSVAQQQEKSRTAKEKKKIAENNSNPDVQAAFINAYAQTTPAEDRAEVFRCMMEDGPRFLRLAVQSEHMMKKLEWMVRVTGTKKYLGTGFWEDRARVSRLAAASGSEIQDTENWRQEPPEKAGFDGKRLALTDKLVRRLNMGTTGLMVVVGGKTIYEYGDVREVSDVSLITPSIVSMLYGKYVAQYKIDLDETLEDIGIDDVGGLLPRERKATVRDVLSCRSGCYHRSSDGAAGSQPSLERGSRLPGSEFAYNSWDFNVAASIFEKKTGMTVIDAFAKDFAIPLGLQDWDASRQITRGDAAVSVHESVSFCLSTRDMARLGEVMLRKGRWGGFQLMPARWIDESTKKTTKFKSGGGYGYFWWVEDENQEPAVYEGAFSARGLWGQRITVIPKLDMVVAHKSSGNRYRPTSGRDYRMLLKLIVTSRLETD